MRNRPVGVGFTVNSRKLEIRRKRRSFLTVGGAYFRGTQTAMSFSSWQHQHQHQQQQSLTGPLLHNVTDGIVTEFIFFFTVATVNFF